MWAERQFCGRSVAFVIQWGVLWQDNVASWCVTKLSLLGFTVQIQMDTYLPYKKVGSFDTIVWRRGATQKPAVSTVNRE